MRELSETGDDSIFANGFGEILNSRNLPKTSLKLLAKLWQYFASSLSYFPAPKNISSKITLYCAL